ncbi:lysine--tRNA ligase [Cycloclasticus pugetii]|jgi:lysyl-tRNA synthetase class 2|uniref:lysine--tRNA ligase n=1 Tax=Cycloclasticus pugetii TaxID=34068 RepID=UPI00240A297B|nr:lysine--tRNA ligase [Cycloclasticus pugetii]MDF1828907.1 lysine--tRNA ligase [Cycloclasticus pugetii]
MSEQKNNNPEHDENKLIAVRREKLAEIKKSGNAYPNDFKRQHYAESLQADYDQFDKETLETKAVNVSLAGRLMGKRVMGKASFAHIQDMTGRMQLFVQRDSLPEGHYQTFKSWDIGDILAVEGVLFKTKTGELSVRVASIRLLTKSLQPLPEKFHGLTDQEQRYRQRYVDLIMNEESRKVFQTRSKVVSYIRQYLVDHSFMEVETPMMHVIPGGATAKPFATHHNALDMELFLRIAPELYLKRLVVGGFERVFEINRSFRNEGLSTRHNPEFTMLEFYQAFSDYKDMMDLTEDMLRSLTERVLGTNIVHYQGEDYDLGKPFRRMSVIESILHYNNDITRGNLATKEAALEVTKRLKIPVEDSYGLGKIQIEIFEKTVEEKLHEPTFITEYPTEVSPLARRSDKDPFVTDRFEFFVGGREVANGFSELNDSEDQAERFKQQVEDKEAGDDEAMHYDADYIRALEVGMPPTAGEGIGIDRLVMFLTDSASIRDVILFPHMKLEN